MNKSERCFFGALMQAADACLHSPQTIRRSLFIFRITGIIGDKRDALATTIDIYIMNISIRFQCH